MHKFLTTIFALVLAAGIPAAALAQGGFYTWSISSSQVDPFVNSSAVTPGFSTFYLWFVEGCHSEDTGGMASAQFKVNVPTGWAFVAAVMQNTFLDAGPAPGADGKQFLIAVGSCPTGPVIAANLLITSTATGRMGFSVTDDVGGIGVINGTVDCGINPSLHNWPEFVRCVGFATPDALPFQAHGSGCTITAVEDESWGNIKGLYR